MFENRHWDEDAPDGPPTGWPEDAEWPPNFASSRKRRWPKVLAGFVVLILALGGYAYWEISSTLDDFSSGYKEPIVNAAKPELDIEPANPTKVVQPGLDDSTTFLIIGSDIRPTMSEEWGRSDTIILARILPKQNSVSLLSLPRDLYVPIPGHGYDKINAAYSLGGPELLIATVREYLGVGIDHFFQIDFGGFVDLAAEVGGAYIPVDQRYFNDNSSYEESYAEIDLRPGYQHLTAEDALAFARFRHGDTDFLRAARQQLFLREVGRQIQQLRSDPLELRGFLKAVAKAAISDLDSISESLKLANTLRQVPSDQIARTVLQAESTFDGVTYYLTATDAQKDEALTRWADPESLFSSQKRKPERSDWERGLVDIGRRSSSYLSSLNPLLSKQAERIDQLLAETLEERRVREISEDEQADKEAAAGLIADGGVGASLVANPQGLHVCKPTALPDEYYWPEASEARNSYALEGERALAVYATRASGYSILWNWTNWTNAPILANPTDAVKIGDESYELFWESGALRMVAWWEKDTRAWITNTLSNELAPEQMLALARSCD